MEAIFANLQKSGQNNVDGLVKWLMDSKIIPDAVKEHEATIRSFFNEVVDKNKVTLEEFKGVLSKVVDEFKTNFDGLAKQLAETGPNMLRDAVGGATSTVTSAMTISDKSTLSSND